MEERTARLGRSMENVYQYLNLVAIHSFGESLEKEVNQQAKSLLGADLVISGREPFTQETEDRFQTWGGEQSHKSKQPALNWPPGNAG